MTSMKKLWRFFLAAILLLLTPVPALAVESTAFTLGNDSLVNTGKNNGYSESNAIDKDDPHWGWSLGKFYVKGYTRNIDNGGKPLFLKNTGDKVKLWFDLQQDIDRLNGNDKLSIARDKKGWDQKFGVDQQDFGRGMLIVRQTNHQNNEKITTYVDFLAAASTKKADTKVQVFEEGDYEVALDYKIKKTNVNIFDWQPFSSYSDYRITFAFSVRNGNSMVFPRDAATGQELSNTAFTPNGFTLDFAQSHYLNVNVRKTMLKEGTDELVEDTRFNKPAADGQTYTDEGVYTITVTNQYTHEKTEKIIYVGDNDVLKAYATTGIPIKDIKRQVSDGAVIADNGTLIQTKAEEASQQSQLQTTDNDVQPSEKESDSQLQVTTIIAITVLVVVAAIIIVVIHIVRRKTVTYDDDVIIIGTEENTHNIDSVHHQYLIESK